MRRRKPAPPSIAAGATILTDMHKQINISSTKCQNIKNYHGHYAHCDRESRFCNRSVAESGYVNPSRNFSLN